MGEEERRTGCDPRTRQEAAERRTRRSVCGQRRCACRWRRRRRRPAEFRRIYQGRARRRPYRSGSRQVHQQERIFIETGIPGKPAVAGFKDVGRKSMPRSVWCAGLLRLRNEGRTVRSQQPLESQERVVRDTLVSCVSAQWRGGSCYKFRRHENDVHGQEPKLRSGPRKA